MQWSDTYAHENRKQHAGENVFQLLGITIVDELFVGVKTMQSDAKKLTFGVRSSSVVTELFCYLYFLQTIESASFRKVSNKLTASSSFTDKRRTA